MPQGQKGFTIFMDFAKMKNTVFFKKKSVVDLLKYSLKR